MITPIRMLRSTVAAAGAALLLLAAVAPAASGPGPIVKLSGKISPQKVTRVGQPLKLIIDTKFSDPTHSNYVLTGLDYLFPNGAVTNGRLFKSCSVKQLQAHHNALSACPKGSKIGTGVAIGTQPIIPVTSDGKLTLFNGPHGKSITMHIDIEVPAQIITSWSAPLIRMHGKYGYKLAVKVPKILQSILSGPIVVDEIKATTGATIVVHGRKRGYIESAIKCPKSAKLPFHADFKFAQNGDPSKPGSAKADSKITCKR